MPLKSDVCVSCTIAIKECHKIIFCKHCILYVHNKYTKLKQSELKRRIDDNETVTINDYIHDINNLYENVNIVDVDYSKYENMAFDPLRYEALLRNLI